MKRRDEARRHWGYKPRQRADNRSDRHTELCQKKATCRQQACMPQLQGRSCLWRWSPISQHASPKQRSEWSTPAPLVWLAPGRAGIMHGVERRVHPLQQLICARLVDVKAKGCALVGLHVLHGAAQRLRLQQTCMGSSALVSDATRCSAGSYSQHCKVAEMGISSGARSVDRQLS